MTPEYGHLSVDPQRVGARAPGAVGPIPPHRVADAHDVGVADGGEPLVPAEGVGWVNAYRATGWAGTDDTVWLRPGVLEALRAVQAGLPPGFSLAVYDGWRSPATVRALFEHYYGPGSTLEPGFLADPDDPTIVPPHTTGAAVDLTLAWQGTPLSLGTAFDDFTPRAHLRALEGGTGAARDLRRLLFHAMVGGGFAANPVEWWHFSLGDQWWAATTGADRAVYGAVDP